MADRLAFRKNGKKLLDTRLDMCDKAHNHHETHRISRRHPTLVFAPGERALAPSRRLTIVAHRAVYSRKLLSLPAWRGPRQLRLVRPQRKRTFLGLRAAGIGSAGPTGGGQRPQAQQTHARSGATVYRSSQGAAGSRGFCAKEESEMITVGYRQRTIYERLAVNLMPIIGSFFGSAG